MCSEENPSPCTSSLHSVAPAGQYYGATAAQFPCTVSFQSHWRDGAAQLPWMSALEHTSTYACRPYLVQILSLHCIPASPPQCWAFEISLWTSGKADVRVGDMVARCQPGAQLEGFAVVILSSHKQCAVLYSVPVSPSSQLLQLTPTSLSSVVLATNRSL